MQDAFNHRRSDGRTNVKAQVAGYSTQEFEIASEATLLQVMERAASLAGLALLPPNERAFDRLHSVNGEQVGPVIEQLEQSLEAYLREGGHSPQFAVELARAIRVNTRWDVAPDPEMSPRQILALPRIHLDPKDFTLYLPESTVPLPLDTPVKLERGIDLEAQRDGKYGAAL